MSWYPTHSHYSGTKPTSPCPILIMLSAWIGSDKYQFLSHLDWLDQGSNPWGPNPQISQNATHRHITQHMHTHPQTVRQTETDRLTDWQTDRLRVTDTLNRKQWSNRIQRWLPARKVWNLNPNRVIKPRIYSIDYLSLPSITRIWQGLVRSVSG